MRNCSFLSLHPPTLGLALLGILGCHRSIPPTIAFIPQTTADDLWEPAHTGAIDATAATGYQIYWNGPTIDTDIERQIALLHDAIVRHSIGVILAPDHPLSLMVPVQKVVSQGTPVAVIGSLLPLPAADNLFYVTNDEEEDGRLAARRIGEQVHRKGTVVVLGITSDAGGQVPRMRAFELTLASEFPDVRIAARYMGSHSQAQAEQTANSVLAGRQVPDGLVSLTRISTLGAIQALRSSKPSKHVVLVGCDQNYSLLYYLSTGELDSIIAENTYFMGFKAAQLIAAARSGSRAHATTITVKPILVTRENMDSPELLDVLTHDARIPR